LDAECRELKKSASYSHLKDGGKSKSATPKIARSHSTGSVDTLVEASKDALKVQDLDADFQKDPAGSKEKYLNKKLKIVLSAKDISDTHVYMYYGSFDFSSIPVIDCKFPKPMENKIRKGSVIIAEGTLKEAREITKDKDDIFWSFKLENCELVWPKSF
jgi:hypothetical protein